MALKTAAPAVKHLSRARVLPILRGKVLTHHLRRLEPGDTLGVFAAALGQPRSSRRTGQHIQHTFDVKIATIVAVTSVDEPTVVAYQVTRTSKRYRPKLNLTSRSGQPMTVSLGKSCYAQVADALPALRRGSERTSSATKSFTVKAARAGTGTTRCELN